MGDKENDYSYELFRWDLDDLKGYISLSVSHDSVHVDDFSYGSGTESIMGTHSHGIEMWIKRDEARKVLEANGLSVGRYPTEMLGLYLAERFTGNDHAFSEIRELAEAAGVKPMIWMDR